MQPGAFVSLSTRIPHPSRARNIDFALFSLTRHQVVEAFLLNLAKSILFAETQRAQG